MIEDIKVGNKVQISYENNHDMFYTSFIEAVYPKQILIYTPIEGNTLVELKKDADYMVKVFNEMGVFTFHNVKISRSFDRNKYHFILLENFQCLHQNQRREHYRLDCMVPFLIKNKYEEAFQAIIKDISAGGLLFVSNLELLVAEERECTVSFNDMRITMIIRVLDKSMHMKPGCKFEYRAKFIFITEEDKSILMKFIFDAQRNYIRRNQMNINKGLPLK